jgi:hypothetical protein
MSTHPVAPPRDGPGAIHHDLRNLDKVRGIFASLAKFVNAQAIYQPNNPGYIKTAQAFEQSFRSYFETDNELVLSIEQYRMLWREQVVYDIGCNTESIAFLLYKDGIGEISIQSSVARNELEQFVGILKGALYNPSAQFDTATALWQAEFPGIFYRVLDEQTDSGAGDGDGSGTANREQPLRANDHPDLAAGDPGGSSRQRSDRALDALGTYFNSLVDREHPGLDGAARESRIQQTFAAHLELQPDELGPWTAAPRSGSDGDELIAFLRVMLEFTRTRCTPPVTRDINDTIERLVHSIRDEGHVPTLTATLELVGALDAPSLDAGFVAIPDRVEAELTDSVYLLSLARGLRTGNSAQDLLRYLSLAGENAVPGLCELLARSSDEAVHEKGCDILHSVAGDGLLAIVDKLDIENPLLATDAVRLLARSAPPMMPPVVQRILASREPAVRRCAIDYLVHAATDEAARLLCGLFKDEQQGVRIRAFMSLERFQHPLIVDELTALCFADQTILKTSDELESLFRALGKVAGVAVLPRLRQAVEKKHLLPSGKAGTARQAPLDRMRPSGRSAA